MKLQNKKSHFRNLPEGSPPRKWGPAIFKYFYFLVLAAIVLGLCYLIAIKFLFFSGTGLVQIETTMISSNDAGTLRKIIKQKGETFKAGDLLAVIDRGGDCLSIETDTRPLKLAYKIEALKSEQDVYVKLIDDMQNEYSQGILPRALEIGSTSAQNRAEKLEREREDLIRKSNLLAAEIAVRAKELEALKKELTIQYSIACNADTIMAPHDGTVSLLMHKTDEYIKKGEPFMFVTPKNPNVFINAYFDLKYMGSIAIGQQLHIEFPDGYKSQGIVTEFVSSAKYDTKLNQNQYLPSMSQLKVRLIPTIGEKNRWKSYDRISVIIKGRI